MAQSSQSGRIVVLLTVRNGNVYTAVPGADIWWPAINTTGTTLAITGVVRSTSAFQKTYFADGTNTLLYDPATNSMSTWTATAGSLPGSSGHRPRLICTWRGRVTQSGVDNDPQNWFMSKVGDPLDWNYFPSAPSPIQADAGNNSTLGLVGDVITALVPYSDDVLYFGGDHTLWAMRGDPMAGGNLDRISDEMGMAWGSPWAKDPYGTLYFVSNKTGIYAISPGQQPVRISQQIEQLLYPLNTGSNIFRLMWYDRLQGLQITVTPAAGGAGTAFFWEQRSGAWWTDSFVTGTKYPLAVSTFDGNTPDDRYPLFACQDGYVRSLDPAATTDDGDTISSEVLLGPISTPNLDTVLVKYLQPVLGETSGTVSWELLTGLTPEAALSGNAFTSGSWTGGLNYNALVQCTARSHWLKLTSSSAWALERIRASVSTKGTVRQRQGR